MRLMKPRKRFLDFRKLEMCVIISKKMAAINSFVAAIFFDVMLELLLQVCKASQTLLLQLRR